MVDEAADGKPGLDSAAPYMPFKTFTNLLLRLQKEGVPRRLDSDYLSNMSGGTRSQLISGLRWLHLIDSDDRPQPTLTALAQAGENRPQAIAELFRTHYDWALALAPQNGTQGDLDEAFRKHGVSGSTLRKSTAFFLQGAVYANLPLSPFFRPTRADGGGSTRRRVGGGKKPKPKVGGASTQEPPTPKVETPAADPAERRRQALFDVLLDKLKSADGYDEALVDRLERIAGTLKEGAPEG